MEIVKGIGEALALRAKECDEQFRGSVRPLYGSSNSLNLEPVGTCFLLEVGGCHYGVTAAHAIDLIKSKDAEENDYSLWVIGSEGTEPVAVSGEVKCTNPAGNREADKFDFAFWELTKDDMKSLGDVRSIDGNETLNSATNPVGRLFIILGYPFSKSRTKKSINAPKKTISPAPASYASVGVADPGFEKKQKLFEGDYILLEYQRYAKNAEGNKVNAIKPKGFSGAGVFDAGMIKSIETLGGETSLRLAGMFLEWHKEHNSISMSVRIHRIVKAIHEHQAKKRVT